MGTCITTIKVLGVTSLGLLSGSLSYSSLQAIPDLISGLTRNFTPVSSLQTYASDAQTLILGSRTASVVLGSLSTTFLALAYSYSPPSAKHPYLIYAALGAPAAIAALYHQGFKHEQRLLQSEQRRLKRQAAQQARESVQDAAPGDVQIPGETSQVPRDDPEADIRDDDSLGKSYIHVSDEESTTTSSTPVSTSASSPQINATEPLAYSIEEEVESALTKKEFVNDLRSLKCSYVLGSGIAGAGFFIGIIGLLGDFYL